MLLQPHTNQSLNVSVVYRFTFSLSCGPMHLTIDMSGEKNRSRMHYIMMSPGVAQALFAKTAWDPCKLRYIHLMLLVLLLTAYVPTIAYLSYFFTAKTVEKDLRWLAVSSCSEVGRSGIRKKPPPATHGHCSLSSQNPLSHWWWPASGPDCAKLRFNVANRFCWSKQNKQMDYKIVSRTFNKYIYIYICVCSNQMYVHVIHVSCSLQQVNPTSVAVWDALERLLAARASFARVRLPSHLTMTVPSHRSESCPERSCPRHSLRFHQKICRVLALAKDRTTAKRGENNRLDGAQYGIRTWTQSTQSMCIQCAFNVHSISSSRCPLGSKVVETYNPRCTYWRFFCSTDPSFSL